MWKPGRANDDAVHCWWDEDNGCYDLDVRDPEATVADYERVVEQVLAAPDAIHKYSDNCIGCGVCCGGRLPLTAADLYRLKKGGLGAALPPDRWVSTYGSAQRQRGCLDITLRLDKYETCALWDRKAGLCSVYASRPLICRTHVCAPLSWRAAEIRTQIVNAGEDELVSMLSSQPFAGVIDYTGVLLKDVCSSRLWRCLADQNGTR